MTPKMMAMIMTPVSSDALAINRKGVSRQNGVNEKGMKCKVIRCNPNVLCPLKGI